MKLSEAIEVLKQHKSTTDKFNHTVGNVKVSEAIDTVVRYLETPPAESEEIPETLKGKAYDYMTQIKDLIKNQHTMSPDLFIANAMSIVCYAYSAGVDFVVDTLKLEKKGEE